MKTIFETSLETIQQSTIPSKTYYFETSALLSKTKGFNEVEMTECRTEILLSIHLTLNLTRLR